jgi:hypothetical protein
LPDFDGTLNNVESYYRELPTDFYGARFEADAGKLYLTTEQQRNALHEIASDRRGSALNALLRSSMPTEELRDRVRAFRAVTLGLSFVAEGLDVKLSIGNPNVDKADTRFLFEESASVVSSRALFEKPAVLVVVAIVLILAFVSVLMLRRRRAAPVV